MPEQIKKCPAWPCLINYVGGLGPHIYSMCRAWAHTGLRFLRWGEPGLPQPRLARPMNQAGHVIPKKIESDDCKHLSHLTSGIKETKDLLSWANNGVPIVLCQTSLF